MTVLWCGVDRVEATGFRNANEKMNRLQTIVLLLGFLALAVFNCFEGFVSHYKGYRHDIGSSIATAFVPESVSDFPAEHSIPIQNGKDGTEVGRVIVKINSSYENGIIRERAVTNLWLVGITLLGWLLLKLVSTRFKNTKPAPTVLLQL